MATLGNIFIFLPCICFKIRMPLSITARMSFAIIVRNGKGLPVLKILASSVRQMVLRTRYSDPLEQELRNRSVRAFPLPTSFAATVHYLVRRSSI